MARQRRPSPPSSGSQRRSSTLPPDALRPTSRAGITFVSLNTRRSPGARSASSSSNRRCPAGPAGGSTSRREASRGETGSCATRSSGSAKSKSESFTDRSVHADDVGARVVEGEDVAVALPLAREPGGAPLAETRAVAPPAPLEGEPLARRAHVEGEGRQARPPQPAAELDRRHRGGVAARLHLHALGAAARRARGDAGGGGLPAQRR